MPERILREARRAAARRAVQALGLTPRRIRAQLRAWGRRGVPLALRAAYWRDLRAVVRRRDAPLSEEELRQIVRPHGLAVIRWNRRKYNTALGVALGLAPRELGPRAVRLDAIDPDLESRVLESWTRENVALIQGVTAEQVSKIQAAVLRSERSGGRAADLQLEIQQIIGASERRAILIARDQLGKFNGQLDRLKQTEAGIDAYVWRTSGDERVRKKHRPLNGQRFTWAHPPAEGHPGQPVQCRCQPEPDLSDLLGDLA